MRAAPSSSSAASRALPGAGEPRRSLHLHRHQPLLAPSRRAQGRGGPCRQPRPHPDTPGGAGGAGAGAPRWSHSGRTRGHGHHRHPVPGEGLGLGPPALLKGQECAGELWCSSCSPRAHSSARQGNTGDPAAACTHLGWAGARGGTPDHGSSGQGEEEDTGTGASGSGPALGCRCRW